MMKFADSPRLNHRSCGILLHPTSLPGPYGIGDLGPQAIEFINFLHAAGQSWWQMFPVGPLSLGNSPYQTLSAFAGNPLLINIQRLEDDNLLSRVDTNAIPRLPEGRVNYPQVMNLKKEALKRAFDRFIKEPERKFKTHFNNYRKKNNFWLENFSLYSALKDYHGGQAWWDWDKEYRARKSSAVKRWAKNSSKEILFHQFVQYVFAKQWTDIHTYALKKKIGLIGDLPLFIARDSADVWAHPDLFALDSKGQPTHVAGVPPDYFSSDGQLWGNPLYRWDRLKKTKYKWWIDRLKMALTLFDVVRLDHFIGFEKYWAIPAKSKTAKNGSWRKGPSSSFFRHVLKSLPKSQIIAEDLGSLTPDVEALRDEFEFPGMKVLQYSFETHPGAQVNRPHLFKKNTVVYTGTHDNDTTVSWFKSLAEKNGSRLSEKETALLYLKSDGQEIQWDMIRMAYMSPPNTAIVPIQDVLGLGSEARINRPGSAEGNWEWRLRPGQLTPDVSQRLRLLAKTYGRQR